MPKPALGKTSVPPVAQSRLPGWLLAGLTAFHPAIFGLVVLAFLALAVRHRTESSQSVITLWWLIAVIMVTAWLPFARLRYVLPVVAPSVIVIGIAVGECVKGFRKKPVAQP